MNRFCLVILVTCLFLNCKNAERELTVEPIISTVDFKHHCTYTNKFLQEDRYWMLEPKSTLKSKLEVYSQSDFDTLKEMVDIVLDNKSISFQEYMSKGKNECYAFGYMDYRNAIKVSKSGHYKFTLKSFSKTYFEANQIEPNYLDVSRGENNMIYLSMSTSQIGHLIAVIFDRETGDNIMPFNEPDYDGNFHMGHNTKDISSNELSVIFMIDDKIGHKHFSLKTSS